MAAKQFLIILFHVTIGVAEDHHSILNIAHRGSSGTLPEHTNEGYIRAIAEGADYIECDVVLTKDLVPVCRHESLLNFTTDVSNRPEFRDKITTTGFGLTGWFSLNFTLEELKKLRTVQHLDFRDQSHNSKYEIATLEEYIEIAKQHDVGIYPEIKDPEVTNSYLPDGIRIEDIVVETLAMHGYVDANSPCYLQSFSEDSLTYVREELGSQLKLVMLFREEQYAEPEDLERYASKGFHGVGCWKNNIVRHYNNENLYKNWIWEKTNLVEECHGRGLKVHVYTFRNEDRYLAWDYNQDPYNEYELFADMGVDGMFTDFPESLNRVLMLRNAKPCTNSATGFHASETVLVLFFIYFTLIFLY